MVGKVRSRPNAGRGSSLEKPKCTFPFAVKLSLSPPSLRLSLSSSPSTACKAPRSTHGRIHEAHSQALLHRLATAGRRRLVLAAHAVGLLDILAVVVTAQRILLFSGHPETMGALTTIPWSLLPTFLVPLVITTHFAVIARVLRAAPAVSGAAASARPAA